MSGEVAIKLEGGKKIEHFGIKIELIGQIEMFYGNVHEFTSLVRELDSPGDLTSSKTYPFDFSNVEKQYDSYNGINVKLRSIFFSPDVGACCKNFSLDWTIFLADISCE